MIVKEALNYDGWHLKNDLLLAQVFFLSLTKRDFVREVACLTHENIRLYICELKD